MKTSEFEEFDAATIVLTKGINLVEAAAGTGKTYAIGMLVLRAVVELEVTLDKILIVTFTKAATEELRSRIRVRLAEARDLLQNRYSGEDQTLLNWSAALPDKQSALVRLQTALMDFDRAAIFTIHGFCQRMLAEQALESGQLFETKLLADIEGVIFEIRDDYWRKHIYALPVQLCQLVVQEFSTPEALFASVRKSAGRPAPIVPSGTDLEKSKAKLFELIAALRDWWLAHGAQLQVSFQEAMSQNHFKLNFANGYDDWAASFAKFCEEPDGILPSPLEWLDEEILRDELNGSKIRGEKKAKYFDGWNLPNDLARQLRAARDEYILALRILLAVSLREEVARRLSRKGLMGFNDLIRNLAAALDDANGFLLVEQLAKKYQVALIDEFQDTDLDQYTIFSRLFGTSSHWLYLIGDPKQAIYSFRGADIHSYFTAQKSAQRKLTLTRNFRSHPGLVDEINYLFSRRDDPFGYPDRSLRYLPVSAAIPAAKRRVEREGKTLSGMHYCTLEPDPDDKSGRWTSGKAAQWLLNSVVGEIIRLLDGLTTIIDNDGLRQLSAGDIAILVRSNRQAQLCLEMLAEAKIQAVLASRQSVFTTSECRELILLLQAIENPGRIPSLKGAMTIPWFGMKGPELVAVWQDEDKLNTWLSRFHGYRQLWQEQGFMAMMSRLLVTEDVFPRLARQKLAERKITNIQHLIELVQEREEEEKSGPFQLLQWLNRMALEEKGGESAELLLESDREAVKIVTMHGAKGLQYPVVFCPYLWYWQDHLSSEKYQVVAHDADDGLVVDLGSGEFSRRKEDALEEQLAEDMRLLYVALTRAMSCCYVMWADVKKSGQVGDARMSSLGRLLFGDDLAVDGNIHRTLMDFVEPRGDAFFHTVRAEENSVLSLVAQPVTELVPPPGIRSIPFTDWQMSSFSAMVGLSEYEYDSGVLAGEVEPFSLDDRDIEVKMLPAGASFGNVVHDLFELLSFSDILKGQENYLELIDARCRRYGVESSVEDIARLLQCVVATPLPGLEQNRTEFSLSNLDDARCLKEIPYYLRFDSLVTSEIGELLQDDPTVAPLAAKNMRGYLTGFIDLVFEFEGSYFLCDYKTNYLGDKISNYRRDALIAAMQSHNYGLQYWLYTVVLNRYLESRLPDFSYERDFGGVMYFFLRGMTPSIPGSGVYCCKPDYTRLLALDRLMGGRHAQTAR